MSSIFIVAKKSQLESYSFKDSILAAFEDYGSAEQSKEDFQRKAWDEDKELGDHFFIVEVELSG